MVEKQMSEKKDGVMGYFYNKRQDQATLYTKRKQNTRLYVKFINGAKLSDASVAALNRR
ncbi:MAG: hypothetical protein ACI3XH_07200 [Phascolarctobacterium sp.]